MPPNHNLNPDGDDLTTGEVAKLLRLTPRTIRTYLASNEFPGAWETRGAWRIPRASVLAYIERSHQ
jgi:excisionase family DNA binding protein